MATLGGLPHMPPTCRVCGLDCTRGEPVAWSIGRDRIHESCIDLALVSTPGGTMCSTAKAAVRVFVLRTGGRLCASCLAMALRISLDDMRDAVHVMDGVAGLRVLPVTCRSCGRAIDALCVAA
jgi:hypothetical protein